MSERYREVGNFDLISVFKSLISVFKNLVSGALYNLIYKYILKEKV